MHRILPIAAQNRSGRGMNAAGFAWLSIALFTLAGTGTVVTGTVLFGAVSVDDQSYRYAFRSGGACSFDPCAEPSGRIEGTRATVARLILRVMGFAKVLSRAAT